MTWEDKLKSLYAIKGWDALRSAGEAFNERMSEFCKEQDVTISDENSEGRDWMVLLKDGNELYVDRKSYDIGNGRTFWVEYDPVHGGITAEFFDADGKSEGHKVVIPNSEIADVSNDWR